MIGWNEVTREDSLSNGKGVCVISERREPPERGAAK